MHATDRYLYIVGPFRRQSIYYQPVVHDTFGIIVCP